MNNIPVAEVSIPTPGVNISRIPVAQNVTPLKKKQAVRGNSKHTRRPSAHRRRRRRASPQVPLHPLNQMPAKPISRPGCRPDSINAACIGSGAFVGASVGSAVPVVGIPIGACVGAACGLGAAVRRRFTGTGRKTRKRRRKKTRKKRRKNNRKKRTKRRR